MSDPDPPPLHDGHLLHLEFPCPPCHFFPAQPKPKPSTPTNQPASQPTNQPTNQPTVATLLIRWPHSRHPRHHAHSFAHCPPADGLPTGTLFSDVVEVDWIPSSTATLSLELSHRVNVTKSPGCSGAGADTEYIKTVDVVSPKLSAFWGTPITIQACVLLPWGFADHPDARCKDPTRSRKRSREKTPNLHREQPAVDGVDLGPASDA